MTLTSFRTAARLGLLLLFPILTAQTASGAPILDQQYSPLTFGGSVIVQSTQSITQTFTVGIDGFLSEVDVMLARRSSAPLEDITLAIVDTTATGAPDWGTVLATALIAPTDVTLGYSFVNVDLTSAMLNVTAGQRLAIYLSTAAVATGGGINPYAWGGDLPGAYAGGATFIGANPTAQTRDMGFRTYVEPTDVQAVPEPASLVLLGTGLSAAGIWRRRRMTRSAE